MKLPLLSAYEVIRVLNKLGFEETRQRGSHKYFKHPDGRAIVVPFHSGRDIGKGLLRKIINEIQIEKEEFLKLLSGKVHIPTSNSFYHMETIFTKSISFTTASLTHPSYRASSPEPALWSG